MILVLAEKEDVAKAISAALPHPESATKSRGQINQGDYLITWLSGHILRLKDPEDYDESLRKWSIESLPINFDNWGKKPLDESYKKQRFDDIGKWLKQASSVIHAGDPDQEGQLLVDEVLYAHNYKGKVDRLNTSDTTVNGLKYALAHMTDNQGHLGAGWSAHARSVADFMVGINMSRLFTCLNPEFKLTVGRVQTPTLGLVVNRDALIEGHQKTKYYTISVPVSIDGRGDTIKTKFTPRKTADYLTDGKILDYATARTIGTQLEGKKVQNIVVEKKTTKTKPPLPFNLVKLQSFCNKKYGMSLNDVMETTQSLRDTWQAITYNRSDCQYLTSNHYKEAPDTMDTVVKNIGFKPKSMDMTIKSDCFNDSYVVNHPAIIPTNKRLDISKFSDKEKKVYLAIAQFYMLQFMPPVVREVTTLVINLENGDKLSASSSKITDLGYLEIMKSTDRDDEEEEETPLSMIPQGTYSGILGEPSIEEKETKPPSRYTQATLAEDMTCISKYVKDERIKRILREKDKNSKEDNGSIGTVATRTIIISGLINNGFLEENGKYLRSTSLGRELFRILPDEIKGVDITAEWWVECEKIATGDQSVAEFQNNVLNTLKDVIRKRDSYPKIDSVIAAKFRRDMGGGNQIGVCPRCGNAVIEGSRGYGCTNWKNGCKFVIWKEQKGPIFKNVPKITKADAKKLLSGKGVVMENLYSPKKDKTFTATVFLDDSEQSEYGAKFRLDFNTKDSSKSANKQRKTKKTKRS